METTSRYWRRTRKGKNRFEYLDSRGRAITDERHLARLKALRIPPAWEDVRIAPTAKAKVQAIGLDKKGRRQYIYSPEWVASQAEAKFTRLVAFARQLPRFRAVTNEHLSQPGVPRDKVLALAARLMNEAALRVGDERYERENKSYGLSTLLTRHVQLGPSYVRFVFVGKRGVKQRHVVVDSELAAALAEVARLPGRRLFQYRRDDGTVAAITGRDLNGYIKKVMGPEFSAKDFRTWAGTLLAARVLAAYGPAETARDRQHRLRCCARSVAQFLGNTPAIAKASYISPRVFACFEQGLTLCNFVPRGRRAVKLLQAGYTDEELELMTLLSIPPGGDATDARLRITLAPEPDASVSTSPA